MGIVTNAVVRTSTGDQASELHITQVWTVTPRKQIYELLNFNIYSLAIK